MLFSLLPIDLFNIFNSLTIVLFIYLVTILIGMLSRKKYHQKYDRSSVDTISSFLNYITSPGQVFFWRTGSANYFYPILVISILLIVIVKNIHINRAFSKKQKISILIIVFILRLLAVHSNEHVALVVCLVLVLSNLVLFYYKQSNQQTLTVTTFATTIGTSLLLFCPSTQHRLNYYSQVVSGSKATYLYNINKLLPQIIEVAVPAII